jgi:nucleoid-associated protein YgaU
MSYLIRAIANLKPNSEFSFTDNDYSTIEWQKITGTPPTQSQIDAEIAKLMAADEQAKIDRETAAASAIAKLEALGLTPEEIKALR